MSLDELRQRLRELRIRSGAGGRLTFTIEQEARRVTGAISRWRVDETGTEDCDVIAAGEVDRCLAMLAGAAHGRRAARGAMTVTRLQRALATAHGRMGRIGRIVLTIPEEPDASCYVTHWTRPAIVAFESCRPVGAGSIADCLKALNAYADEAAPRQSRSAAA